MSQKPEWIEIEESPLMPPLIARTGKYWVLAKDYQRILGDVVYSVRKGFAFDLASIPRPIWFLIAPFELSIAAPLIHDWLYRFRGNAPEGTMLPHRVLTRKEVDVLFRVLMEAEGVSAWRREAAYRAVRLFGRRAWRT